MSYSSAELENVERFRSRARRWLATALPRAPASQAPRSAGLQSDEDELARISRCRELQRAIFDGGFAGICVPSEYGGQGLSPDHQRTFNEEIAPYDYPTEIQVPTFTPCMALLLEFGTDRQKEDHIPAMLKGDEIWMQLLSEPSGGSDVAAARTTALRDGEEWILNGSKIWTTGAWWADWGLCLARTNWDVPKHRGLSVFLVPLRQSGVEVRRIEMLDGSREFCQEYLTDVRIPARNLLGIADDGWTVGIRWMYHERLTGGGSPYVTRPPGHGNGRAPAGGATGILAELRRRQRSLRDRDRLLIGEARTLEVVGSALTNRIQDRIQSGAATDHEAAISRLFAGTAAARIASVAFEVGGRPVVAWADDQTELGQWGTAYLLRQASSIGGGTVEMSRNVISERVLGMPRERSDDRGVPFREAGQAQLRDV